MASNWIKMRDDLWTHPRFIGLNNALIYGDDSKNFGLAEYVFGEVDMMPGFPPNDETVTDKLLRTVTKRALQSVTMCSLLRVWHAVNSHSKVKGSDAVLEGMFKHDLDEIAGFSGFSDALETVGWLEADENRMLLIFKNFCEFNEPSVLRKKEPLSNAERQRRHRLKTAENKSVTKNNDSNDREEKIREEKNIKTIAPEGFNLFWQAYPKKSKKSGALKIWLRLKIDKALQDKILRSVEAYKKSDKVIKGFVMEPTTWLNNGCWDDEPSTVPSAIDFFTKLAHRSQA